MEDPRAEPTALRRFSLLVLLAAAIPVVAFVVGMAVLKRDALEIRSYCGIGWAPRSALERSTEDLVLGLSLSDVAVVRTGKADVVVRSRFLSEEERWDIRVVAPDGSTRAVEHDSATIRSAVQGALGLGGK